MPETGTGRVPKPFARHDDEMVVALPHLNLVMASLDHLEAKPVSHKINSELGLALLKLQGSTLTSVNRAVAALPAGATNNRPGPPETDPDRILWGLRQLMVHEYGFYPTLGKNRLVGTTQGVGWVIHGSVEAENPQQLERRPDAPPVRPEGPGRGTRVGVLDTELYAHPWLAGGWTARYSDRLLRADPKIPEGHSTFLTGLILSQAPGTTVECRQLLGREGIATCWDAAVGIVELGHSGLDVLNLSFACYTEDGEPPLALATAIDRLDPNLVVVAAAGNHGAVTAEEAGGEDEALKARRRPAWPAALDDVIAVGAVDAEGERASFSPDTPWIDVHARGVDLRSTYVPEVDGVDYRVDDEAWASWNGTSFAAALVSGAVASAIDPGRVSGTEAMRDLLHAVQKSNRPSIGRTRAKALPLRVWQ